jgi:uncharacterized protein DUF1153
MTAHYWTFLRKAELVRRVLAKPETLDDVLATNEISIEEFESWRAAYALGGAKALRVTRIERVAPRRPRQGRRKSGSETLR